MRQLTLTFLEYRRRWLAMPARMRAVATLMMAAALVLCILVWGQAARRSRESLLAGQTFSLRELAKIEGAFAGANLNQYEIVDGRVIIPRSRRSEYIAALMDGGALPDRLRSQIPSSSAGSFLENAAQRKSRQLRVLEQKLATSISCMNGVDHATVHIDEAILGKGFHREHRVTAMVVVEPTDSKGLSPKLVRSIRGLVAGAKVEMQPAGVTVTDLATGTSYSGTMEQDALWTRMDEYLRQKQHYEKEWNKSLAGLLQFIPGVQVTTNIEFQNAAPEPDPNGVNQVVWPRSSFEPIVNVLVNIPGDYYQHVLNERIGAGANASTLAEVELETHENVKRLVNNQLPQRQHSPGAPSSKVTVVTLSGLQMPSGPSKGMLASTGSGIASSVAKSGANLIGRQVKGSGAVFSFESRGRFFLLVLSAIGFGLLALFGFGSDLKQAFFTQQTAPSKSAKVSMSSEAGSFEERNAGVIVSSHGKWQSSPEHEGTASSEQVAGTNLRIQPAVDDNPNAVLHEEITYAVRENPEAAAELLQKWLEQAA